MVYPPVVVRDAVKAYTPPAGCSIMEKSRLSSSFIDDWGVRIRQDVDDSTKILWVCLASDHCRRNNTSILMSKGKTSKPAHHLKHAHDVLSGKTVVTAINATRRQITIDKYRSSALYRQDPKRFVTLLETLRVVINNLPYRSVEYEESILLRELCYMKEFRTAINTRIVDHSIKELYHSTKREIHGLIDKSKMRSGSFTLVTDFWTSKVTATKYIGIRLYMIGPDFRFRSILLATRAFNPKFGDRDLSIREPFYKWIINIINGFGLTTTDLFGATTDKGGDVRRMMRSTLKLEWEWCLAHLSNAATKEGCGLVDDVTKSKNLGMTKLVKAIVKTVYETKHVEKMGTLFEELCKMISSDNSTQLLDYRSHRFLGLTRVVERILLKWTEIKRWYLARVRKAHRDRTAVPTYHLRGYKRDLIQLLSLLKPIARLNSFAQVEGPEQVDVLLDLFTLRSQTLNPEEPLHNHRSLPAPATQSYFAVSELTPLISLTRKLLCQAFDKRYFCRYINYQAMKTCSYAFEMQLALHPDFKNLEASLLPTVLLVNRQNRVSQPANVVQPVINDGEFNFIHVAAIVKQKINDKMMQCLSPPVAQLGETPVQTTNRRLYGTTTGSLNNDVQEGNKNMVRDELLLWFRDRTALQVEADRTLEGVLTYWKRQEALGRYKILPQVVRAVFTIPTSSAQLERDFGVTGMHVTPQRASTGKEKLDVCAFPNRNQAYVDITQCGVLEKDKETQPTQQAREVSSTTNEGENGGAGVARNDDVEVDDHMEVDDDATSSNGGDDDQDAENPEEEVDRAFEVPPVFSNSIEPDNEPDNEQ